SRRTRGRRARAASLRRRALRAATPPICRRCRRRSRSRPPSGAIYSPGRPPPIDHLMESVLPLAGFGFALGWPLEWVIQRFPRGTGTAPSSRRRWIVAAITAALFALEAVSIGFVPELLPALLLTALVVPAAAIDLEHRIIPDLINKPGAVA